jgi:Berberine and berberine like
MTRRLDMSGDEQDRVPEVYRQQWDRLCVVKAIDDAKNCFRLNQSIPSHSPAPRKYCSEIDDLGNRSYSIMPY